MNEPPSRLVRRNNAGMRRATINKLLRAKTVTLFGSLCLLINAATGPAIPFTANLFQVGGSLPTILLFGIFLVLSTFCCLFIVEAIQAIPGNMHFQGNVEFATLINFYFGSVLHVLGQVFLYGAVQSNAIQSIVLSSQTFDNIIAEIFGKSCALTAKATWICVGKRLTDPSPFGDTPVLLTVGFLFVIIFSIPLAIIDLDNNIGVQVGSFCITALLCFQWCLSAVLYSLQPTNNSLGVEINPKGSVPMLSRSPSGYQLLTGNIMLSLAFTFVVPSWINLKKRNVSTQGALWTASSLATMLYIFIGWIPGTAFRLNPSSGNVIPALSQFGIPVVLTKVTTYLFPIVMLMPSIPVSFLVTESNLVQNELAGKRVAQFLAYLVPWFVTIPFLTGNKLNSFIMWTSLIFVSSANFIIPIVIFLRCLVFRKSYNLDRTTLTAKQRKLLKLIHARSNTIKNYIDSSSTALNPDPIIPVTIVTQPPNTDDFSGISEQDINNAEQPVVREPSLQTSILRKSTVMFSNWTGRTTSLGNRVGGGDEMVVTDATDADIEMILAEDVPDPVAEDMEWFRNLQLHRGRGERTSRDSSSAFLVESAAEHGEDMEMGSLRIPVVRWATELEPSSSSLDVISSSSKSRLRSRSPVSFVTPDRDESSFSSPLRPPVRTDSRDIQLLRKDTLPSHPQYIGRTFRSVPRWVTVYISPRALAIGCLSITGSITVVNIVLNLANP